MNQREMEAGIKLYIYSWGTYVKNTPEDRLRFNFEATFSDFERRKIVERTERGVRAEYLSDVSNYPRSVQHLAPKDFLWLRVFEVYPPFAARLVVHFPNGGRLWILNAASPIAARKTRLFCPLARNFDKDKPVHMWRGATLAGVTLNGADFNGADLASTRLVEPIGLDAAKNFDKVQNIDRLLRE